MPLSRRFCLASASLCRLLTQIGEKGFACHRLTARINGFVEHARFEYTIMTNQKSRGFIKILVEGNQEGSIMIADKKVVSEQFSENILLNGGDLPTFIHVKVRSNIRNSSECRLTLAECVSGTVYVGGRASDRDILANGFEIDRAGNRCVFGIRIFWGTRRDSPDHRRDQIL